MSTLTLVDLRNSIHLNFLNKNNDNNLSTLLKVAWHADIRLVQIELYFNFLSKVLYKGDEKKLFRWGYTLKWPFIFSNKINRW